MATRRTFNWDKVIDDIKTKESPKTYEDDSKKGLYSPKLDDTGNAAVIIRFLPPHPEESSPFVKIFNHGFKDINGWFIENCPSTIGEKCPVCTYNSQMWNSGNEEEGRKRKRKLSYYANILVVKDPNNPENDGKVFKFRYGIKIHEKIMEKISPKNPDIDDKVIVFDYQNGANFKLKVKSVSDGRGGSYPNYDSSTFSEPSPISLNGKALTDEQIDEVEKNMYKIEPIIDKSNFKSFDELSKHLTQKSGIVVGDAQPSKPRAKSVDRSEEVSEAVERPSRPQAPVQTQPADEIEESGESDEDFFARLSQG